VAAIAVAGALVVLLPWPVALLGAGDRGAAWGFGYAAVLELSDALRFQTGPDGAGAAGWMLLLAAGLAVLVTTGPRLAWVARGWMLALVGFALAWLPSVIAPDAAVPAPEGLLVPAALGVALAVGLGVGALRTDLHSFHFGWRQVAAVAVPLVLVVPVLGFVADTFDGRWRAPATDWNQALSWMESERAGGFRVLWVGDPAVLPLAPTVGDDGTGYGITRDGPGGSLDLWPAPGGEAAGIVGDAVELARDNRTNRLGHLLAPMGVRYVALPPRSGADGGAVARPTPELERGLADQLDLSRLESDGGLVLYENDVWVPTPSVLPDADLARLRPDAGDPTREALTSDLATARPVRDGKPAPPGAVLQAESYSSEWAARVTGRGAPRGGSEEARALRHAEAFGWANGYELRARGPVAFAFEGQWRRNVVAASQVALWLALAWFWARTTGPVTRWRKARRAPRGPTGEARSAGSPGS
jgi:hypothetical protein